MFILSLNFPAIASSPLYDFVYLHFSHHVDSFLPSPALCRSAVLTVFVMGFMLLAEGYVLPLEFNRDASSNYTSFGVPATSAHNLRKGWRRQVLWGTPNEDTASAPPLPASGSGGGPTTARVYSEVCTPVKSEVFPPLIVRLQRCSH